MIKAVLFDLDGTLVNSLADLANSVNFALSKHSFPTHTIEKYKYFVGDGMVKLIERALPENLSDDNAFQIVFEDFMSHYRKHFMDKTLPYDGIEALLKALKEMGMKTAVVSNKLHEMTLQVVENLLDFDFDYITGKRDGFPTKPDPSLTEIVMQSLNVTACECVFIGDSGMDMSVAKNVNCKGVGVLWGFRTEEELRRNGADYIVSNPNEILDIIKELNK